MRRTALSIAAAGVAAGLALAPAAAMAAPAIYVYTWDSGELIEYTDPEAGIGDVIPTTSNPDEVTGIDVGSDGAGFAVDYTDVSHLYSLDVLTGDVVDLGELTFAGETVEDCTGLDLTGGVLTIVCDEVEGDDAPSVVLTVDPATRVTTLVTESDYRLSSLATDPSDGQLYGFGYSGEIVEISSGSAVQIGSVTGGATLWGADFASDGSLWATVDDPSEELVVGDWVFHPAALNLPDDEIVENITVYEAAAPAPAPQLAATGTDVAPALFGAVALMAVGAGLAVAVSIRRRAA